MKLLLDAGHGGHDPGAVSGALHEEDLTLAITLALGNILRECGYSVLYTRDRDTYISPSARLRMIWDYNPDGLVSVHCNASNNPEASGFEVIYRDEYDRPLAVAVQQALATLPLRNRGIKTDVGYLKRRLAVLSNWQTPACLVEVGFITNAADRGVIEDIDLMAAVLAEGIEAWASRA